jgi:transposase
VGVALVALNACMDDSVADLKQRAEAAERLVAVLTDQLRAAELRDRAAEERDRAMQAQIRQLTALVKAMRKQLNELLGERDKADKFVASEVAVEAEATKPDLSPPKTTAAKPEPPPPPPERKDQPRPKQKPVRRADPAPSAEHETRTTPVDACGKCRSADVRPVGAETSVRVEYVRAHVRVVRQERATCQCRSCGAFTTAPAPPTAVPGGIMSASLLAHIAYSKGFLHLPLNRIAEDLALLGVNFASATMSDAMHHLSTLLGGVSRAIKEELFSRGLMWFDGSGIKVLQPGEKGKHLGQIAVYSDAEAAVYDYTPTKHGSHAATFLRVDREDSFAGYLHADAASTANVLYRSGKIKECGCWYHARDLFVAARVSAPEHAAEAIAWISALFEVEHEADQANDTPELRLARRHRDTKPVLAGFVKWMAAVADNYSVEEELPKAIRYVRNHWVPLNRILEDGRIHLTNNRAERDLAPLGRGRKSWLHAGSDAGGTWLADVYTIVETCRREGLDPYDYVVDVLPKLSVVRENRGRRAADLTPNAWKRARESRAPP